MTTAAEIIEPREGCKLTSYKCPAGIWTIGYGHTGPEVSDGMTITQEQANALLAADLVKFEGAVRSHCPETTSGQFAAMVSLCYNIGEGNFSKSSVARLHNAQRYPEAGQAFALWNKGGGRVLAGLVARRAEEARVYLSDLPPAEMPVATVAEGEAPLTESRTMNGQAITAAATVAGGGITAVHDHAPDLQQATDALGSIAPYFQWAAVAIAVIALGGIGWTFYARWHDRNTGRA